MLDALNFVVALLLCTNSHFTSYSPLPTSVFAYFMCSLHLKLKSVFSIPTNFALV